MRNLNDGLYLGADGFKKGWIVCVLDHGNLHFESARSMEELVGSHPVFDAFLIDMIIGLRSRKKQERPEDKARKEVGPRHSSVFPAPCRQAVYAETEEDQKRINREVLESGLTKQTIHIIPKIRELDVFMDHHPEFRERILESHPEVAFARLKGDFLRTRKKDRAGLEERARILEGSLPGVRLTGLREKAREFGCSQDDLLDAACLALTAAMSAHGMCDTIPEKPHPDDKGLYMKLTVPKKDIPRPEEKQKTAVVTGGARGIGRCIAEEFRKQGVKVYVIDSAPGDHYAGDLADKSVLEDFAETVIRESGGLDYLINNAPPIMKGIDTCSYEDFQKALSVGVTAPFYLSKLFAPYFRKGACIINISSSRDRMSQPRTESYTAAKGGIAALTHALAASFAGRVRVNSISPGWIDTDYQVYEGADALQQPAGRVGNPMDIAAMVLFLCSDKAGFITGENICIDGGMTRLMIYHEDHGWTYRPEEDGPGSL